MGRPGGDQDVNALQVVDGGQRAEYLLRDLDGFRHPSGPLLSTGEGTRRRFDHPRPAPGQGREVLLHRSVPVHAGIHGREDQHGCRNRQKRRGQQPLPTTVRQVRRRVRRAGGDGHGLRPLRQADVGDGGPPLLRQEVLLTPDAPAGEGGKHERADEVLRGARHDDLHLAALPPQAPHQLRDLVGGDAPRDAEQHPPAPLPGGHCSTGCDKIDGSPGAGMPFPFSTSRSAMER